MWGVEILSGVNESLQWHRRSQLSGSVSTPQKRPDKGPAITDSACSSFFESQQIERTDDLTFCVNVLPSGPLPWLKVTSRRSNTLKKCCRFMMKSL